MIDTINSNTKLAIRCKSKWSFANEGFQLKLQLDWKQCIIIRTYTSSLNRYLILKGIQLSKPALYHLLKATSNQSINQVMIEKSSDRSIRLDTS